MSYFCSRTEIASELTLEAIQPSVEVARCGLSITPTKVRLRTFVGEYIS